SRTLRHRHGQHSELLDSPFCFFNLSVCRASRFDRLLPRLEISGRLPQRGTRHRLAPPQFPWLALHACGCVIPKTLSAKSLFGGSSPRIFHPVKIAIISSSGKIINRCPPKPRPIQTK